MILLFRSQERHMAIEIRRAQANDATAITRILISLGYFERLNSVSFETAVEWVNRHLQLCHSDDSHSIYVAEERDLLGYVSVHWLPYLFLAGPEGYVSELFVHATGRGRGIGTQLLEMVKQEAIQRDCARLSLLNNRNRESYQRQFYEKHGWQERPVMANFVLTLK
jgi:GNAT superfamily N-acetyltransferase